MVNKKNLKALKIESSDVKVKITKPQYDIYDDEINKKMLKKFMDENK